MNYFTERILGTSFRKSGAHERKILQVFVSKHYRTPLLCNPKHFRNLFILDLTLTPAIPSISAYVLQHSLRENPTRVPLTFVGADAYSSPSALQVEPLLVREG
jgi:hypothetical protein